MDENNNITIDEEKTSEETEETVTEKADKEEAAAVPEKKKGTLSRKGKRRLTSTIIICLVIVGIILLNVVALALTSRFPVFTADITSNSAFELTEDSVKLAESVSKKVRIQFMMKKNDYESVSNYCKQATSIASQLASYSNGMVSVEYIDLVADPTFQTAFPEDTLSATDVVVSCGEKYNILSKEDMFNFELYADSYQYITSSKAEQAIDSAILKVTSEVVTNVALITDDSGNDHSYFEKVLYLNNYNVIEMTIADQEIPDTADTVIIYAPTKDFSEEAISKLEKFIYNGGSYKKNLMYISNEKQNDLPNINAFLKNYGVMISDGLAFDMDSSRVISSSNNYDIIVAALNTNVYSDGLTDSSYPILSSRARGLSLDESVAVSVLQYSSRSGVCPYDADEDTWNMSDAVIGDVCVMSQSIYGNAEAPSNIIVCGSALMWDQTFLQSQYSNRQFLLNMMGILNNRQDPSVQIAEKVITQYDLNMSVSEKVVVGVIMFAVIPLMILGAGLIVFIVRRRK